jgi:hypothetical protein
MYHYLFHQDSWFHLNEATLKDHVSIECLHVNNDVAFVIEPAGSLLEYLATV